MSTTKTDIPYGLTSGVKTIFANAYKNQPARMWRRIAMVVPSTKDTETYAWLGENPRMREWIGPRQFGKYQEYGFTIANKTWEASLEVGRTCIEDEQYGQVILRVHQLAEAASLHDERLVFEKLASGITDLCFDGQAMFSASHPISSPEPDATATTFSNLGTSALSDAALKATITAMLKMPDDRGNPMGIVPDTLVVPVDLEWDALTLLNSDRKVGTANNDINELKGRLDLIASPYLTDTTDWFVLCTKGVMKPIIYQDRVPVEMEAKERGSDVSFETDSFRYGLRQRKAVGYGIPQYAYCNHV